MISTRAQTNAWLTTLIGRPRFSAKIFRRIAAAITVAPKPDSNSTLAADSAQLLALLDDLDTLLGSVKGFLFGKWLADAEAWGTTPDERKLMRWNAKTQVTFWEYPQPVANNSAAVYRKSNLQDYACTYSEG